MTWWLTKIVNIKHFPTKAIVVEPLVALIRGCAYWACKGLIVFVDDNYALARCSLIVFLTFIGDCPIS